MAKKSRSGASYKAQYQAYKTGNKWKKNRTKKLEKRVLANENDTGAVKALDNLVGKLYRRKKPGSKGWFHAQEQKLIKDIKSKDEKVRVLALEKLIKLKAVQADKRPSAIINAKIPEPNPTIADQLYNIGMISEKYRNAVNSRMGSIRKR
jgi:hypothetical protein